MKLNELQSQFKDSLLYNISFEGLRPIEGLEGQEGLGFYKQQYLTAHENALRKNYPALAEFLDEEASELFEDYIHYNPSRNLSLNSYGEELAAYLKPLNISRRFPFLPYLAQLEWKIKQVKEALPPRPLQKFYLERGLQSSDCHIKLIEAHSVYRSPYGVYDIWRSPLRNPLEEGLDDTWRRAEDILIHQKLDRLFIQKISPSRARFLFDLQRGLSLNEALAQNLNADATAEELIRFISEQELVEDILCLDDTQ